MSPASSTGLGCEVRIIVALMTTSRFGVRAKLNIGLCIVLLMVTVAFGTGYAFLERHNVLEARRAHLRDMARMARPYPGAVRNRVELESRVETFSERTRDEIGVLADRLAEMSRRLPEAVRSERYGSAHLVALRVRRELEEPLRRSAMQLTVLGNLLSCGSDADRAREEIAAQLKRVGELVGELDSARTWTPL